VVTSDQRAGSLRAVNVGMPQDLIWHGKTSRSTHDSRRTYGSPVSTPSRDVVGGAARASGRLDCGARPAYDRRRRPIAPPRIPDPATVGSRCRRASPLLNAIVRKNLSQELRLLLLR
jgi:hypothetical protein